MTKRTISWLLCLMMVVSLFTGTLTSVGAANTGVTIDPASAVIYQTGSQPFTVRTVLDTLLDRAGTDKNFDLDDLVQSLKGEGLNVNTLTDLLSDAGFNWDDILGSLTNNSFTMDEIAGALLDNLESGDLHLEDILGDLTGDEASLSGLLDALKEKGFDSDLFDSIWDLIGSNTGSGTSISDLIGGLIGRFGGNSVGAMVLSASDEPEEDNSVTTIVAENLKEKLREKYGDLFTGEKEAELDELFAKIDAATDAAGNISLSDAVSAIISNENFDLAKTVDVIMDATNGSADYSELVSALKESTGSDLSMEDVAGAFSDTLGDSVDWNNLAEALESNLANGFDTQDFLEAIGSGDTDLSGITSAVSEALGMDQDAIDADAVKNALNEALKDQGGFDADAFAEAMGEGFDSDAFLQSVADKLSGTEGEIDASAVEAAIEEALGEQSEPTDLSELAKALKDAMGDDFSVAKLTEALTNALKGEDGEAPSLDDIVSAVTDAMGGQLTNEQLNELISGLTDSLGEDMDVSELAGALANNLKDQFSTGELLDALKAALGEDYEENLDEIVSQLLGEGTSLSDLINALKERDFSTEDISDLLFGAEVTYQWWSHTGKTRAQVTGNLDSNLYSGEKERTLTVTRSTPPTQEEVYHYYCVVKIGTKDQEYTSSEAVLTIKTESAPVETTEPTPTAEPTARPTAPVLDNVTHKAYISGYPDGRVYPGNNITRAEVATIFFRLLTEETREFYRVKVNTFSDVSGDDWFNEAVSTLARASVLNGYRDGTFLPNNPITRAELATILTRLTVLVPTETAGTPMTFKDVNPATDWAYANIRTASANGWITGYPDGTFHPNQFVTRAEAATMINRMLGRNPLTLINTEGMRTFSDNADTTIWYYRQIQEAANGHDYIRDAEGNEAWVRVKN